MGSGASSSLSFCHTIPMRLACDRNGEGIQNQSVPLPTPSSRGSRLIGAVDEICHKSLHSDSGLVSKHVQQAAGTMIHVDSFDATVKVFDSRMNDTSCSGRTTTSKRNTCMILQAEITVNYAKYIFDEYHRLTGKQHIDEENLELLLDQVFSSYLINGNNLRPIVKNLLVETSLNILLRDLSLENIGWYELQAYLDSVCSSTPLFPELFN